MFFQNSDDAEELVSYKAVKKDKCIIGGKEYQIKNKKKVIFNWSKKPGIISKRQPNSTDNSNLNTK